MLPSLPFGKTGHEMESPSKTQSFSSLLGNPEEQRQPPRRHSRACSGIQRNKGSPAPSFSSLLGNPEEQRQPPRRHSRACPGNPVIE